MMTKLFFFLLIFFSSKSYVQPFDLGDVCQNMWDKAAGNNLNIPSDLTVDTVGKNPLITLKPTGKTKVASVVFTTFKELLRDITQPNIDAFLNEITKSGGPLEQALNYLNANVFTANKTMPEFKTILEDEWFSKPLPGKGFKHVFVGEKLVRKGKNVYSGFHNWYQFFILEGLNQVSNIQLDSFTNNTKPYFIVMNFQWDNANKTSPSSLYVGTSPAFDFALFSTCFTALYKGSNGGTLGKECTCKIHNNTLTLIAIEKPPGKICTVYPTKVAADVVSKSLANTVQTACELDDCCPTTTTTTTTTTTAKSSSQSGGNDDYYYAKRGCFFICYVFYVFIFY